jgi:hypothetical protein
MDYPLFSLSSLKPFNTTAFKKQNRYFFYVPIFPSHLSTLWVSHELWKGEKKGKRPGNLSTFNITPW